MEESFDWEHEGLLSRGYVLSDEKCLDCNEGFLYKHGKHGVVCNNHQCLVIDEDEDDEEREEE